MASWLTPTVASIGLGLLGNYQARSAAQDAAEAQQRVAEQAASMSEFKPYTVTSGFGTGFFDEEAQKAMSQAFARLKLVAEPGGAVALAAALYHGDQIDADTVICTISGGNVDRAVFLHALDQFGEG